MKKTIKEYGGKEVYASKAAQKMHEKKETKKFEAKEGGKNGKVSKSVGKKAVGKMKKAC